LRNPLEVYYSYNKQLFGMNMYKAEFENKKSMLGGSFSDKADEDL
jgi:hypothetical protein